MESKKSDKLNKSASESNLINLDDIDFNNKESDNKSDDKLNKIGLGQFKNIVNKSDNNLIIKDNSLLNVNIDNQLPTERAQLPKLFSDPYNILLPIKLKMAIKTKADLAKITTKLEKTPPMRIRLKEPLNYENWSTWSYYIMVELRAYELGCFVNDNFEADAVVSTDYKELDAKVKDQLIINVIPEIQKLVMHLESAKIVWNKLDSIVNGTGINKSIKLTIKLQKLLEQTTDDLKQYTINMQLVIDEYKNAYPENKEEYWLGVLVGFIPSKFNYLRSNLSSDNNLTLLKAYEALLQEAQFISEKRNDVGNLNTIGTIANIQSNKPQHQHQQSSNNNKEKSRYNNHNNKFKNKNIKCEYVNCQKSGHYMSKCYIYLRDILSGKVKVDPIDNKESTNQQLTSSTNKNDNKNKDNRSNNESFSVGAIIANSNAEENELNPDKWYLDTCAAVNITNSAIGCTQLIKQEAIIKDWENKESRVQGVGKYTLLTENGDTLKLENVLYKSSAAASFLSWPKLDRTGKFKIVGEDGYLKIYSKSTNKLIMTGKLVDSNLYELEIKPNVENVRLCPILIKQHVPTELMLKYWHVVLGHCSFNYLTKIAHQLGITGKIKNGLVCDVCNSSKAKKIPFNLSNSMAKEPFELVHADLSGIIRISNYDKVNYFLLIVDDNTRYITCFLLGRKFQVNEAFKYFMNWVNRQFGKNVKRIRSDNGGEFLNEEMNSLIKDQGIVRELTIPYTPQQNARVERVMRTITTMARALLKQAKLPVSFWPYAILFAVYLKNRLPHKALNYNTPFNKLFKSQPTYDKIMKFGQKVHVKMNSSPNKFADRGLDGIFVGYPQNIKGFYVYLIEEDKIIISRDIYISNNDELSDVKLINDADSFANEDRESNDKLLDRLDSNENESINDENQEQYPFIDELDENERDTYYLLNDLTPQSTTESSESSQIEPTIRTESNNSSNLKNYSELGDLNLLSEQPTGRIIMNRNQKAIFSEIFPTALFTHEAPYAGGNKTNKNSIWNVAAVQAPKSYNYAINGKDSSLWQDAMDREIKSQLENKTWTLVKRPYGAKVLPLFWLYKYVYGNTGLVVDGKARLVVGGHRQLCGLEEFNYAPVVNWLSIRLLLSLVVNYDLVLHHIDCKTAFLNAPIAGDVYVNQPAGFVKPGKENMVLKLDRAVYGLRQSARQWYTFIKRKLIKLGFQQLYTDGCVFKLESGDDIIIVMVYVDDLLCASNDLQFLEHHKEKLSKLIKIKDYGNAKKFLGLNIDYDKEAKVIKLDQKEYLLQVLDEAGFSDCKPVSIPMQVTKDKEEENGSKNMEDANLDLNIEWYQKILGKLIYVSNIYRLDLSYTVNKLCAKMKMPNEEDFVMLKHVLRYIKGTIDYKLVYKKGTKSIEIYADANFNSSTCTTGIIVQLNQNTINWCSKKQQRVCTSTCEAEILSILDACGEATYIRDLLLELNLDVYSIEPSVIFNDNMSSKSTIENGGKFDRNRHYKNRLNYIIRAVEDKIVTIKWIDGKNMLADGLTKAVPKDQLINQMYQIGLKNV